MQPPAVIYSQNNLRPLRDLVAQLPRLPVDGRWNIDFQAADPALLATIAADAEATMAVIQSGLGAIGHLLAHSAVVIEDGTVGADSLESLGFLMAELGDLAAACMVLGAHCRQFQLHLTHHGERRAPSARSPKRL